MKRYIVIGVLIILSLIQLKYITTLIEDKDRLSNNIVELQDSIDTNIKLSINEFNLLLKSRDDLQLLLNEEKIKKSKIKTITIIKEHYQVDTVEVLVNQPIEINDTTFNYPITYNDNCLTIEGTITTQHIENPFVTIDKATYDNELVRIAYLKRKPTGRKFLFINIKKKYIELITNSKCGTTTSENIDIVK